MHQKRVTFFITFTNVFFIFRIKNAFLTFFFIYFFPNVYYNYALKSAAIILEPGDGSPSDTNFVLILLFAVLVVIRFSIP